MKIYLMDLTTCNSYDQLNIKTEFNSGLLNNIQFKLFLLFLGA